MKKTAVLSALIIAVLLPLLIFSGCTEHGSVTGPQQADYNSPQFIVVDATDVNNAIQDATLESDMKVDESLYNYSFINKTADFKPGLKALIGILWMERFDFSKHLGLIFKRLNLTDEQKAAIKEFSKTYHETMKPLVKQYFDANKTIMNDAKAQRKLIMDDLKTGKLTRDEAKTKLKDLNASTRDKIAANPESVKIKEEMCKARDTYFNNVKSVLTTDQLTKWDEFISKIKNPCQ
ncbi:MAG: Spy/CpxP family protein refolding chaperone [Syntrophothermus sp.]